MLFPAISEKISVILPCYNESGTIITIVEKIHDVLKTMDLSHEIIVIDDHSPDDTYSLIGNKNYSYVFVYLNKYEKSLAKSIQMGIENSTGDILVLMDSDFNHSPDYLPILISNLAYYDCVMGSRFMYGGSGYHKGRYFLSWIYNIFIRIVTRNLVTDSLYGFLAFRKKLLDNVKMEAIFWGFGDYCIRLLFYFQKLKISILQIPVVHGNRISGIGNKRFLSTFGKYTLATLKLSLKGKN